MTRARIPREVLADRLRSFVLTWRESEVWEVAESVGGNLMSQFQAVLGAEFGEPGVWEIEANSSSFLTNEERRDVYDVLLSYVQAGVLRPITGGPMNQSQAAWAELYITPFGREVLAGGAPLPEDMKEFLQRLATDAPHLDPTTYFYVEQALRAFLTKLFPVSAVMLGCAAEHSIDCLAHALVPKLPPVPRGTLTKALAESPLAGLWRVFRSFFDAHRSAIFAPHGLARTAEAGLDGLFLVVRQTRDDSGHPTEVHLTENATRALLQVFLEHARYASIALEGISQLPNPLNMALKHEGPQ